MSCQLTVTLILGILFVRQHDWRVGILSVVFLLTVLWVPYKKKNYRECMLRSMLLGCVWLLGVGTAAQQIQRMETEKEQLLGQQVYVRGTLVRKEYKNERWQLTLSLAGYVNQIIVSTEEGDYPLDSVLSVEGLVKEFQSPRNEGQFNEKSYYENRRTIGRMYAEDVTCIRAPEGVFAWRESLYCFREKICEIYRQYLPAESAGIMCVMAVGEKTFLDEEVRLLFQHAGLSHILAISGMHISMLGMAIYRLLEKCRLSLVARLFAIIGSFLLYGTMIGMGVSATRAIGMFLLFMFAQCIGRRYDTYSSLSVMAFVTLVTEPGLLFDVSFQLSYTAVFAVATAAQIFKKDDFIERPLQKNAQTEIHQRNQQVIAQGIQQRNRPVIAKEVHQRNQQVIAQGIQQRNRPVIAKEIHQRNQQVIEQEIQQKNSQILQKKIHKCLRMKAQVMKQHDFGNRSAEYFLNRIGVPILLQLFTLPLVAYYYYELPVYALVFNFLLLPYLGVVLGCGLVGGCVAVFCASVGKWLLLPCRLVLEVYVWVCSATEKLPGVTYICGRPKTEQLMLYYIFLTIACILLQNLTCKTDGKKKRCDTARLLTLAGVTCSLIFILCRPVLRDFEIDVLDVGQGDGAMIYTAGGSVCLIDGGSSDVKNVGTYRLLPFLKSKGIARVDYWILSHLDEDHVSGFYEVLEAGYSVGAVLVSEYIPKDDAKQKLAETLDTYEIPLYEIRAGQELQLDEGVLSFLAPDASTPCSDANSASLVCLYENTDVRALFTGDIGEVQENWIQTNLRLKPVDVYKVAHHGSKYSNSYDYLQQLSPRVSLISCAKKNLYGHPHPDTLERLREVGSEIFCTAECGQITVKTSGEQICIEGYVHN